MSKNSARDRIERLKREQEAAAAQSGTIADANLVEQLTHEEDAGPDFAAIAKQLEERKEAEKKPSANANTEKFTIYVDKDIAAAFKALCTERGDQKRYATQAFAEFVEKKVKELGL